MALDMSALSSMSISKQSIGNIGRELGLNLRCRFNEKTTFIDHQEVCQASVCTGAWTMDIGASMNGRGFCLQMNHTVPEVYPDGAVNVKRRDPMRFCISPLCKRQGQIQWRVLGPTNLVLGPELLNSDGF